MSSDDDNEFAGGFLAGVGAAKQRSAAAAAQKRVEDEERVAFSTLNMEARSKAVRSGAESLPDDSDPAVLDSQRRAEWSARDLRRKQDFDMEVARRRGHADA